MIAVCDPENVWEIKAMQSHKGQLCPLLVHYVLNKRVAVSLEALSVPKRGIRCP
jgi:hypothetical protein